MLTPKKKMESFSLSLKKKHQCLHRVTAQQPHWYRACMLAPAKLLLPSDRNAPLCNTAVSSPMTVKSHTVP